MSHSSWFNKIYGVLFILLILLFSCQGKDDHLPNSGFLKGTITIGPLCPVETNPPDPNCQPTAETYKTWATAIYSGDHKKKIRTINPDESGSFTETLPAGIYIIDLDAGSSLGIGSSNLPLSFNIVAGDTQKVAIDIDTGIR